MDAANPFWEFSLALYQQEGVETACVEMQDRLGIDVNLLLACCWSARCGLRLDADFFEAVAANTRLEQWNASVVHVLRRLRRQLKNEPEARVQTLRQQVLQAEISAERVYQDLLLQQMPAGSVATDVGPELLYSNLHTYWRGLDLGAPVWEDVQPLIEATCADHDLRRLRDKVAQGEAPGP